ncbi:MAG: phosphonopyruvate decarboxylase [Gammaproteobacteria bacterium]|nr:phosphonopyruvate decarboxylase [Gammaproteobacteria bacterium]
MPSCAAVYEELRKQGLRFFTGVPDSLLKDFCAYITDQVPAADHVIAANEGNAVALAVGHFLGTGEPALVYMQNSGIGNGVNPLLSLADPEVYSIPMLLVIGWRGEPGVKDEPQHVKQGRIMTDLLDAMEIPWRVLDASTKDPAALISAACESMRERMGPAALLVRAGAFERYTLRANRPIDFPMTREDAVKAIVDALDPTDVVVSTTGKTSRELFEHRKATGVPGNDFLTVGGMGHTASIAMGLARSQPARRVVCLDGDGSAIMHMGSLAVIGNSGLTNLLHVVINNGSHESVGGQPTVGHEIDFPTIARACGYRHASSVSTLEALRESVAMLRQVEGPALLEVKVRIGSRSNLGRPTSTPLENRDALMKRLGLRIPESSSRSADTQ